MRLKDSAMHTPLCTPRTTVDQGAAVDRAKLLPINLRAPYDDMFCRCEEKKCIKCYYENTLCACI